MRDPPILNPDDAGAPESGVTRRIFLVQDLWLQLILARQKWPWEMDPLAVIRRKKALAEEQRVGPDTAFVSPFTKRKRALPTIGNKRGLTENKFFPAT
jgi:hypothetical protein